MNAGLFNRVRSPALSHRCSGEKQLTPILLVQVRLTRIISREGVSNLNMKLDLVSRPVTRSIQLRRVVRVPSLLYSLSLLLVTFTSGRIAYAYQINE